MIANIVEKRQKAFFTFPRVFSKGFCFIVVKSCVLELTGSLRYMLAKGTHLQKRESLCVPLMESKGKLTRASIDRCLHINMNEYKYTYNNKKHWYMYIYMSPYDYKNQYVPISL